MEFGKINKKKGILKKFLKKLPAEKINSGIMFFYLISIVFLT